MAPRLRVLSYIFVLVIAASAFGASAPVIDSFTATPAVPVPGQNVALRIAAHDPDCTAPPCTSACGTAIRSDLLVWTDDSGRTTGAFTASSASPTGSPWNASVTWIAPSAPGTYTVRANVVDNGGMLCGGRQTRVAALQIQVTSSRPPAISACTVTPSTLAASATATVVATASDPLGRALTYAFAADAGTITHANASSNTATWTAPKIAGNIALRCTAIADGVSATLQTMANVEIGAYERTLSPANVRATRTTALPDGRLAAADGANGTLSLIGTNGGVTVLARGLKTPIAVASAGDELFVLERDASRISVWTKTGTRLRELPLSLVLPNQLVAGPGPGELAVADTGASRVVVLSAGTGRVLRAIGEGMLNMPAGLATSGGRLAVADATAARILIFDPSGVLQTTLGDSTSLVRPQGLAWDAANERVIVADSYSGELTVIGEENAVRGTLGGFGTEEGRLVNPIDVTLLAGSLLAVTTTAGELPLYRLSATLSPLEAPQSLTAADRVADDGGAIALTWTKSPDDPARITAYRIERAPESGDAFTVVTTVGRSTTSSVDTNVADGVCQRYRVVATDGVVEAASNVTPCALARNDLAPPAPESLVATADSPTAATLTWDGVTANDLRGYVVETNGRAPFTTTATSAELTGLTPGTRYDVTVRAIDVADNLSAPAASRVETYGDGPPPAPVAVVVTDAKSGGAINISWTAPQSNVPIAHYRVAVSPAVEGWPARSLELDTTSARITGLANQLAYAVSVTSVTPWDRESEPSTPQTVTPTAPPRALPLVAQSDDFVDAWGIALEFGIEAEKRELRLQYRAVGTTMQVAIDGVAVGAPLADTGGAWTDASIAIEKRLLRADAIHVLELRSVAFPDADARLAVRRIDFVPLVPKETIATSFNTVADITWRWDEARPDLAVILTREDGTTVNCTSPQLARCRDTFLENNKPGAWTLRIASPAGWVSEASEARGLARWSEGPPPVTDLAITERDGAFELTWTRLSSALTRDAKPVAVRAYRIYAAGALIAEVTAPPALVRGVDPLTLVVRSVDAEGRESQ